MDTTPLPEHPFFTPDEKLICDMLQRDWSLGTTEGTRPKFAYRPDQYSMSSRVGSVYVYRVRRTNDVSSTDRRTYHRESYVNIKLSTNFWDQYIAWGDEIYRILLSNSRLGVDRFGGYMNMDLLNDTPVPDLSGWYTVVFSIRLVVHAAPVNAAGFGDILNKQIDELQSN